jgi:hypothetical protein
MMASGYSLHLYCDNESAGDVVHDAAAKPGEHRYGEFPHQFTAETGGECRRDAKKDGWLFTRDGKHYCPRCRSLFGGRT